MGRSLCVFFTVLLLGGCASGISMEAVAKQISNAELMISQARQNDAEEYAPLELKLAEEQILEAKTALNEDEVKTAERKVEMAMEHARLAQAKSETAKAKKEAQEEMKDVNTLRKEINRAIEQ